jgi:pyruvate ferredoxin oxidoreductase gamma subunit
MQANNMYAVRIHGRGGQGVVTAAELLAMAIFAEGGYAQAFPTFGSERTGAPVAAFCRIDTKPIRSREPIAFPDAVIIADVTLLRQVDVFAGLQAEGYVLITPAAPLHHFELPGTRFIAVPATEIAVRHVGRSVPGAALLGAFAAATGRVQLASVMAAIRERFPPPVAERNCAAAEEAYTSVLSELKERIHA